MTKNVHWTVPLAVSTSFTGRKDVLAKIRRAFSHTSETFAEEQQKRFIITGLGGLGKSEICLKIADLMRNESVLQMPWLRASVSFC